MSTASEAIARPVRVSDIIYHGFRIAGVLGNAGRDFLKTGSYYTDAFAVLNAMIDQWATERLMVTAELPFDFPLTPGVPGYTIGPGGDWRVPRPSRVERANIVLISENAPQPLELPMFIMSLDGWRSIPQKSVSATFPLYLYYDMNNAGPGGVGLVSVFPVPQVIDVVRLFLWAVLQQFGSVNDTVSLPPGYLKAIQYNLARELAMRFPERTHMTDAAVQEAVDAKAKIKSLNMPDMDMPIDEALIKYPGGFWNWRTGNYQGSPF